MTETIYALRYAPGSSKEQVLNALKEGQTCCCCVLDFEVIIHHDSSHQSLCESLGLQWEDRITDGNFSLIRDSERPYIAVRLKSPHRARDYHIQLPQWPSMIINRELLEKIANGR